MHSNLGIPDVTFLNNALATYHKESALIYK
jgi:hypothetical protein